MSNSPEIALQYRQCLTDCGLWLRGDRGLIEVTGGDRAKWLHNLVTNAVATLTSGEGNYAFAINVKGRTLFDLNLLVLKDRIWLDLDRRQIDKALTHFEKYTIVEDVKVEDLSARHGRVALLGPGAAEVAKRLGVGNLTAMASLQHGECRVGDVAARLVRHDFAGLLSAELLLVCDDATAAIEAAMSELTLGAVIQVGAGAIEILRIESGIPASVVDIDEDVIPPETGQVERGISHHKGCYLGQEVIERMRAHKVLARRLVGMRFGGAAMIPHNTPVHVEDREVGRVTSCCWSEALGAVLALGYIKTAHAAAGKQISARLPDAPHDGEIVALPIRR